MKLKVYDLPTRIFHWAFALCFILAFVISNTVDDESKLFSYHMLVGIVMVFTVVLRIAWGLVGTRYARFSGFVLNPADLFKYLTEILTGKLNRWAGHNPASSWAAIIMIILSLGLGITGYLMVNSPASEFIEELHEILANAFLIPVILHICGIILHTIRHKEFIGLSMISGEKENFSQSDSIHNTHHLIGVLYLLLIIGFGVYLFRGYNSETGSLSFLSSTYQLHENEVDEHDND